MDKMKRTDIREARIKDITHTIKVYLNNNGLLCNSISYKCNMNWCNNNIYNNKLFNSNNLNNIIIIEIIKIIMRINKIKIMMKNMILINKIILIINNKIMIKIEIMILIIIIKNNTIKKITKLKTKVIIAKIKKIPIDPE